MTPTIHDTIDFIKKAHEGTVDKAGAPYWLHPVAVMARLGADATEAEKLTALLHDVIEDTGYSRDMLDDMNFPAEVLDAVELLTRPEGMDYLPWIKGIADSGNLIAIKVKIADIEHNTDPGRVAALPPGSKHPFQRYIGSLEILRTALPKSEEQQTIEWQLDAIARQIRGWLDWHKKHRDREFLTTVGDTAIMSLPVPMWPNHAQFENWIKTLESARVAIGDERTPAAHWRLEGKPDPHAGRYDCDRAALVFGELTDDELANAVFLEPTHAYLTAAKDRIRWLSRALEKAIAAEYPKDLTPALREVLGLMIMTTCPIAHGMRDAGENIPRKTEEEQAHVLHWLIGTVLEHGDNWRKIAGEQLTVFIDKAKATTKQ